MTDQTTGHFGIHLTARQRLEVLGAILLALFLFALDGTVVGVALPKILTDLHGNDVYTWAVTIYLLTATISGPIYGKLSDLFGRRPIVIWAVSLFLVASVGAGLSQEAWQLILFRGLQGLGGGRSSRSQWRSSPISTPRPSAASTSVFSGRCSGYRRCWAQASAG